MARDQGAVPREIELDTVESNYTAASGSSNEVNIECDPLPFHKFSWSASSFDLFGKRSYGLLLFASFVNKCSFVSVAMEPVPE